MINTRGYAAAAVRAQLAPFTFQRRDPGPQDVVLDLLYCGICHSDIHYVHNDWGISRYPLVPGHEIVGRVTQVGSEVTKFSRGELAAIGCLIDSCRTCRPCQADEEHLCEQRPTPTYAGVERGTGNPTYGGYSDNYVVDQRFALKISPKLDPAATAPLLCAGITTYSPLRHWKVGPGQKVGVVGLGGLGHMGVKIAAAMGAEVTVFTTSPGKREDALALGAVDVVISRDAEQMAAQAGKFDFILNTVAAPLNLDPYLAALKRDGTMVLVGVPAEPHRPPSVGNLVMHRRSLAGSLI